MVYKARQYYITWYPIPDWTVYIMTRGIKNYFNYKLSQLQIESTIGRINSRLQSQRRSKSKVKESQKPTRVQDFNTRKCHASSANTPAHLAVTPGIYAVASWAKRAGSCELEAGKQTAKILI